MKKILVRSTLVAAALVGAVLVADRSLRAANPLGLSYFDDVELYLREAIQFSPDHVVEQEQGRIFQNRPRAALQLRDFAFRTDDYGLRVGADPPPFDPAVDDALRILFVGDSVTLGWGVDDEDTWVRILEREGRTPGGEPIRCLNGGHLMYDTVQEASYLRAFGGILRPDVVVLTFILNDIQPTWEQVLVQLGLASPEVAERAYRDTRLPWSDTWLARMLPGIHDYLRLRQELAMQEALPPEELPPRSYYPEGWPRCEDALDDLLATCGLIGARLVVFDGADGEIPDVRAWCERNGVPFGSVNLTEEEKALDVRNSAIDPHANALGNRLIADKALAALRELGLLGPVAAQPLSAGG